MYIELEESRQELKRRDLLKTEVEKMWCDLGVPFPLRFTNPTAVVGKHPMFRIESVAAIHMAEQAGLDIAWLAYKDDLFVSISKIKRSVVKPVMTDRFDKSGEFIVRNKSLVTDLNAYHRKPMDSILTGDDVKVLDYHRDRLLSVCPQVTIFDISTWTKMLGGNASFYYEAYLSLFVAHAVLFEDYHGGESDGVLSAFTQEVVEPAIIKIKKRFGVNPLIVKLPWKPHYAFHPYGGMYDRWREMVIPKL